MGWIGVDLDGTLAVYDGWKGVEHIGQPIMPMVRRVTAWLSQGREVRIFTARVGPQANPVEAEKARFYIQDWCLRNIGMVLPVTHIKDFAMDILYDDRCVTVEKNTGELLTKEPDDTCKIRLPKDSRS